MTRGVNSDEPSMPSFDYSLGMLADAESLRGLAAHFGDIGGT
jgi:hypothetical protein